MTAPNEGPSVLITAHAFAASEPEASDPLRHAGVTVLHAPEMGPLPEAALLDCLPAADVVIASSDRYTPRVLDACPRLRGIVRWGVGVDSVDLEAAAARGILVANTPGTNSAAVADFTLGLMLAASRRLDEARAVMAAGEWRHVRGVEMWRKTLGIIGFGAIGQAVCRRGLGFEMRVLACDPQLPPEAIARHGAEPASVEQILAESDFLTLHAALTPATRGLIDAAALRAMKPTAFLVNAARGAMVDEAALLQALDEGWIAGAAIDCYADEPLPPDHPLRRHPRCFATPHTAFNTHETAARTNAAAVEAALAILRGQPPASVVNPSVLTSPAAASRLRPVESR